MLYSVPAALRKHSCTTFVSMMVTKPIRIFSSTSPVTQTADTYTYFPGLLEVPLLQWPIPLTWQTRVHRRQEHQFSSMLLDASKITSVCGDRRWFQLPSKVNERSKDSGSAVARRTDTSSYEGEKGGPDSARGAHTIHTPSGDHQNLPWFGSSPSSLVVSPSWRSVALRVREWDGRVSGE